MLLADFVTLRSDWRNILRERDLAVLMYSVGSGMVLAIGDLAGTTAVTLLAATAIQSSSESVVYGRLKSNLP